MSGSININMDMKKIHSVIIDAITASGKEFKSIKKDTILSFLQKQGVPMSQREDIYRWLVEYYNAKSPKEDQRNVKTVVDYTDNSHNDVKTRSPRKSVFTEINKIAG